MNTEEAIKPNSSKLIEREKLEGTPFWLTNDTERNEIWIIFGQYKIHKHPFENTEEAKQYLDDNIYNIMLTILAVIQDINGKINI